MSDRQQRHPSFISEYVTDISHIRGQENIIADSLSRLANAVTIDLCDLQETVNHQHLDEELKQLKDSLKPYHTDKNQVIMCEILLPFPKHFVLQ